MSFKLHIHLKEDTVGCSTAQSPTTMAKCHSFFYFAWGCLDAQSDPEMTNNRKGALQEEPPKPDPRNAEETRCGDKGDQIPGTGMIQPTFLEHLP